jgi:putative peptidoglycan lipid II flippase
MLVLGGVSILNVALGFGREATIAYFFGTSAELDTFLVALALPQLLVFNLAEITVAVVLPMYIGYRQAQKNNLATALVQKWFWFSGAVIAGFCVLLFVGADLLMYALAPGFDTVRRAEAAGWLRTLLPYVWLLGVAGVFKAVLNSHDRFFVPAFSSQLVSVCVIAACAVASHKLGVGSLAVGFVTGAMLGFTWQLLNSRRLEPRLPDLIGLKSDMKLPIVAGGAMVLNSVALQLDTVIDRAFASGLPEGSIAAYNYACMISGIPTAIVTSAIATALFPVLAKMTAGGDWLPSFYRVRKWSLVLFFVGIGPVLLLVLFRTHIVSLVFERGAFGGGEVVMTSEILQVYPYMILVSMVSTLFTQLLVTQHKYRIVAFISFAALFAKISSNLFAVAKYGIFGLAISTLFVSAAATSIRILLAYNCSRKSPNFPLVNYH